MVGCNEHRRCIFFKLSEHRVEETINFHGIALKMSVDNQELYGYGSYSPEQLSIKLPRTFSVLLKDYLAWA
jgi:hypothetical protein